VAFLSALPKPKEPVVPPRVVLVTGVSRYLGTRLAATLAADPSIERVIGVDTVQPRKEVQDKLGRTEFVRADIRNPLIAKVIAQAEVDTVVHMNVIATPLGAGGRTAMKEINVIGTMQLLAACQQAPSMRKLVVKSTTAVYGSSPRDPALFTEDAGPKSLPKSGYAKDAVEVEGYVRGFGRRRPDVTLSLLRFTNFIGPVIETPLTRYLQLPVVPTVLGFDPRIQLCHEDDGIEVLRRCATEDHPGIFNIGGRGVLLLSQAIRRAGRPSVPIPSPTVSAVAGLFRRAGLVDFSPEQMRYLQHGRVADVSRAEKEFGWVPRSTAEGLDDFVQQLPRLVTPENVGAVEDRVLAALTRRPLSSKEPAHA
jgi:UDP-glucose 4-epimerase